MSLFGKDTNLGFKIPLLNNVYFTLKRMTLALATGNGRKPPETSNVEGSFQFNINSHNFYNFNPIALILDTHVDTR